MRNYAGLDNSDSLRAQSEVQRITGIALQLTGMDKTEAEVKNYATLYYSDSLRVQSEVQRITCIALQSIGMDKTEA